MSDEEKKSIVSKDEIKRCGKQVIDALYSLGCKAKNAPPALAGYAGDVVGIFEKARQNPNPEIMARAGVRIATEQHNLETIAHQAGEEMSPKEIEKISDIDEDWKASFLNEAKIISDKEMQSIWANILRGKARDPNAFSKRTVKLVSDMDKKDAEMFTDFCQFVAFGGPLIYDYDAPVYNERERMFYVLKHLDDIGLISADTNMGYVQQHHQEVFHGHYHGRCVRLQLPLQKGKYQFRIGKAILTNAGEQLLPICGTKPNWKFWDYLLSKWEKFGYKPITASSHEEAMRIFNDMQKSAPPK